MLLSTLYSYFFGSSGVVVKTTSVVTKFFTATSKTNNIGTVLSSVQNSIVSSVTKNHSISLSSKQYSAINKQTNSSATNRISNSTVTYKNE